ncbi:MAG: S8 family serine peptidase [Eubacterium sp.]|nr:S8 family serine peptidase [Eubacterium sp.]
MQVRRADLARRNPLAQRAELLHRTALLRTRPAPKTHPHRLRKKSAADPYVSNGQAYQLKTTNAEQAWSFLEGRKHGRTTVAVIDTGVDTEHEDLQKNLITKNGCYTRAANGTDTQTRDDSGEHGTHVSGISGEGLTGNGKRALPASRQGHYNGPGARAG